MSANISITISTILLHTVRTNRKIARQTVKYFSVFDNPFMHRTNCVFA